MYYPGIKKILAATGEKAEQHFMPILLMAATYQLMSLLAATRSHMKAETVYVFMPTDAGEKMYLDVHVTEVLRAVMLVTREGGIAVLLASSTPFISAETFKRKFGYAPSQPLAKMQFQRNRCQSTINATLASTFVDST